MAKYRTVVDTFNLAAPGANTDFFAANLSTELQSGGIWVISIALTVASVFNLIEDRGAVSFTHGLNRSSALTIADQYEFQFPVTPLSSYNFQVETDGIIDRLLILEEK